MGLSMATDPISVLRQRSSGRSDPARARSNLEKGWDTVAEADDIVRFVVIVVVPVAPAAAVARRAGGGRFVRPARPGAARTVLRRLFAGGAAGCAGGTA